MPALISFDTLIFVAAFRPWPRLWRWTVLLKSSTWNAMTLAPRELRPGLSLAPIAFMACHAFAILCMPCHAFVKCFWREVAAWICWILLVWQCQPWFLLTPWSLLLHSGPGRGFEGEQFCWSHQHGRQWHWHWGSQGLACPGLQLFSCLQCIAILEFPCHVFCQM